jgi:hypothetical protein
MTFDPAKHWDKVAAELRACRDAQRQAWGDVDDALLGRYLADESSGDERRQVEQALEELPELRLLTDVVRDVLAAAPPEAPAVVPLPRPQARRRWAPSRQKLALLAAACLLLALGVGLARPVGSSDAAPGAVTTAGPALAVRLKVTELNKLGELAQAKGDLDRAERSYVRAHNLSRKGLGPQHEQTRQIAQNLARVYEARRDVDQLNRLGTLARADGDLDQAEQALREAYTLSVRGLGPQHEQTRRIADNLAEVYQVALADGELDARRKVFGHYAYERAENPYQPYQPYQPTVGRDAKKAETERVYQNAMFLMHGPQDRVMGVAFAPEVSSPYQAKAQPRSENAARGVEAVRGRLARQDGEAVRENAVAVLCQKLYMAGPAGDRALAALALAALGPAAGEAVPALTARLREAREPVERVAVLAALGRIGRTAAPVVPEVLHALHAADRDQRRAAAFALANMGYLDNSTAAFAQTYGAAPLVSPSAAGLYAATAAAGCFSGPLAAMLGD